jgi:hypothetical protein
MGQEVKPWGMKMKLELAMFLVFRIGIFLLHIDSFIIY